MRPGFARLLLICLTILGLTLPRISAVIALATPGGDLTPICTGHELQTLRIDPDGKPVPTAESQSDHCLLLHAADTAARVVLPPVPIESATPLQAERASGLRLVLASRRPPPRGPPAA